MCVPTDNEDPTRQPEVGISEMLTRIMEFVYKLRTTDNTKNEYIVAYIFP